MSTECWQGPGDQPWLSPIVLVDLAIALVGVTAMARAQVAAMMSPIRRPGSPTADGLASASLFRTLGMLALCLGGSPVVLFSAFRADMPQFACNVKDQSILTLVLNCYLALVLFILLISSVARVCGKDALAHGVVMGSASPDRPVSMRRVPCLCCCCTLGRQAESEHAWKPSGSSPSRGPVVAIFRALRGRLVRGVARELATRIVDANPGLSPVEAARLAPTQASVLAVHFWNTRWSSESDVWLRENAVRSAEKAQRAAERGQMRDAAIGLSAAALIRVVPMTSISDSPLRSSSIDEAIWPFFLSSEVLSEKGLTEARRKARILSILTEILRTLKPGGRFYTHAFPWQVSTLRKALAEAGFQQVQVSTALVWVTVYPVYVIVGHRHHTEVVERGLFDPWSTERESTVWYGLHGSETNSELVRELAGGFGVDLTGSRPVSPSGVTAGRGGVRERLLSGHEDDGRTFDVKADEPVSRFLWLRIGLTVAAFGIYIGMAVLSGATWGALDWPMVLPWSNRLNTQFVGNIRILPLGFTYMWEDLAVIANEGVPVEPSRLNGWGEPIRRPSGVSDIARRFGRELLVILLGITLFNLLFWAPSFGLDLLLYQTVDPDNLSLINIALNIVVAYIIAKIGLAYAKRKQASEAAAMEAAIAAKGNDDEEDDETKPMVRHMTSEAELAPMDSRGSV
jgi:hypothetical protein